MLLYSPRRGDDMGVKIPYGYVSKFMEKEWEKALIMVNKIIYEAGEPEQVIRSKSIFFPRVKFNFCFSTLELSQSSLQVLI